MRRRHGGGELRGSGRVFYRTVAGPPRRFDGTYVLLGTRDVAFRIGRYDASASLTIDPLALFFATFATGRDGNESLPTIAAFDQPDLHGQHHVSAYVTGTTTSMTFPTTPGGVQPALKGTANAFVLKLNESGTDLVYATYLGGTGMFGERANGIAVGSDGSAYVVGNTDSIDFPTTQGALQPVASTGGDAFVTRLSPDGSRLVYSTYLGGSLDEYGYGIAVDAAGDACVTGGTGSTPSLLGGRPDRFPLLHQAQDYPNSGAIFMAKFDPTGTLTYSSVFGSTSYLSRSRIAADATGVCTATGLFAGVVNKAGSVDSYTLKNTTASTDGGCSDPSIPCRGSRAFVLQLDAAGAVRFAGLLGAPGASSNGNAIAAGASGNLYVARDVQAGAAIRGAVTQVDPVAGTVVRDLPLAGTGTQSLVNSIAVVDQKDVRGNLSGSLTFGGWTDSTDFPYIGPLFGNARIFIVQLDLASFTAVYGGRFPLTDYHLGLAVDTTGSVYAAGTAAFDFPTTPGVFQPKPPNYPNVGRDKNNLAILKLGPCPDADGDGLCDDWERSGVSIDPGDGSGPQFIDLPKMGADPQTPDVFLQIDWMDCAADMSDGCRYCVGGANHGMPCAGLPDCPNGDCRAAQHSHALARTAIKKVVDAFAQSPYRSPTGSTGVHVHVDEGPASILDFTTGTMWGALSKARAIAHADQLGTQTVNGYGWAAFDAIKKTNFLPTGRAPIFHYVVSGHGYTPSGSSGLSRAVRASDLIVTLGRFTQRVGSVPEQAGTLMHEFGHNLGLHHGGSDDDNYKPNYASVMSYAFQIVGLTSDGGRTRFIDYSRTALGTLDEAALDEAAGLGAAAGTLAARFFCLDRSGRETYTPGTNVDWNCNGTIDQAVVSVDVNGDGQRTRLTGYEDWPNIKFVGGAVGRGLAALTDLPTDTEVDPSTPDALRLITDLPTPLCTSDAECDDADACTTDSCDPGAGCVNAAIPGCSNPVNTTTTLPGGGTTSTSLPEGVTTTTSLPGGGTTTTSEPTTSTTLPADPCAGLASFDGVQCVCLGGVVPAACTADRVPPAVGHLFQRACSLMRHAAGLATPRQRKKPVHTADGAFARAIAKVAKAKVARKHPLSPACGAALGRTLGDAKHRTDQISVAL